MADAARRSLYTADELLDADLPEARPVVPGLLVEGLNFVAGRPKIGKSWFALEASRAVASGGSFLGRPCSPGSVVFFALEDSPRRLQNRLRMLGWPRRLPVTLAHDLSPLGGSLAGIPALIERSQPSLVVIDTFYRALGSGVEQRRSEDMTELLSEPQRAALDAGCCLLVLDHHRKPRGGAMSELDQIDELMESSAKGAAADSVIGIFRKRGERFATLKVTGRDFEDSEMAIEMDKTSCRWTLIGEGPGIHQTYRQGRVRDALEALGGAASVTAVAERSGLDRAAASRVLRELTDLGAILALPKHGKEQPYQLAGRNGTSR